MSRYELLHGDCLEKLKGLPDNSVDAVVTDPPAGIAFMGRSWDEDKGGRREWIAWLASIMGECLRVLKPGGHALVWALPRTSHWTATAIEDAGFEVKDCVVHIFGSGFPKSHNISKAIDKMKGAKRPVIGLHPNPQSTKPKTSMGDGWQPSPMLTAPATPEAAQWEGFGSALKPASEHWWLCRKPLTGTIAANVLEWGTGGINVDACRVATTDNLNGGRYSEHGAGEADGSAYGSGINKRTPHGYTQPAGRFPPNVLFSHLPECRQVGTKKIKPVGCTAHRANDHVKRGVLGFTGKQSDGYLDPDGLETVEAWECAEGCAVKELDEQSAERGMHSAGASCDAKFGYGGRNSVNYKHDGGGARIGDSGGASRFFPAFRYQAKAPPKERKVEGVEGQHPTQKPEALCRWLVRLVTPPNGVVLDPFTGSGTTGVAALLEGFRFIGCEREDEYYAIAKARLDNAVAASTAKPEKPGKQGTLFDMEET